MKKKTKAKSVELNGRTFDALDDAEKERIFNELEAETPEQRLARSRPLNAEERAHWKRVKKKMGRPRVGAGSKPIAVTLEKGLLKRADAYAKEHGMKRAQLIAHALKIVMGEGKPRDAA